MEAARRRDRQRRAALRPDEDGRAPPVRNPDAQLAAADIDTSRLDADTNNWGPRLGVAWSPPGGRYVVRGGWGLFYGRTPSIMLGTAHSNNGVNIVSLTFTGDAVPTYPQKFSQHSRRRHGRAPEHLLHRQGLRELAADAGQRRVRVGADAQHEPRRDVPLRRRQRPAALDRSQPRRGGVADLHASPAPATTVPYHVLRAADRPFANFAARDRLRVDRRVALQRPDARAEPPPRRTTSSSAPPTRSARSRTPSPTPPPSSRATPATMSKYASNPANFDADRTAGNNDQRHRFVAERGLRHRRARRAASTGFAHALVKAGRSAGSSPRSRGSPTPRASARSISTATATRATTSRRERRATSSGCRRSSPFDPRIARDIPLGRARLQLIWEAFNLFNRDNIIGVDTTFYSVTGTTLTPSDDLRPAAGERRRTHHADRGEDHVLN